MEPEQNQNNSYYPNQEHKPGTENLENYTKKIVQQAK